MNEPDAAVCTTCGLILLKAATPPQRRAEDYAGYKRRARDQQTTQCPFCHGDITMSVVRCRHCSEIVDDDYYRARAQLTESDDGDRCRLGQAGRRRRDAADHDGGIQKRSRQRSSQ